MSVHIHASVMFSLQILEYGKIAVININRKGTNNTKQYITIKK